MRHPTKVLEKMGMPVCYPILPALLGCTVKNLDNRTWHRLIGLVVSKTDSEAHKLQEIFFKVNGMCPHAPQLSATGTSCRKTRDCRPTEADGLSKSAAAGKAEVTIIEKKDHVDLCIPHPRSMVNSAFAQEALLLCRHN